MEAIGGYFDLEVPRQGEHCHPQAHRFQSGRAALLALLEAGRPARVWLPWHICSSVLDTVTGCGTEVARYSVDENFAVAADVSLGEGDWLLYVNHFGLQERRIDALLRRFPAAQVVVDNAQAFYSEPRDCLATLYSPRKFLGVPDGGYLVTSLPIPSYPQDEGSVERAAHLLIRAQHGAEAGYAAYQSAERSLERQPPRAMSELTSKLLRGVDHAAVCRARRENFDQLQQALGGRNRLQLQRLPEEVPLCYPYLSEDTKLRERLIAQQIFVPTYWPESARDEAAPAAVRRLSRLILPLPCDQRYGPVHLQRMVAAILAWEGRE